MCNKVIGYQGHWEISETQGKRETKPSLREKQAENVQGLESNFGNYCWFTLWGPPTLEYQNPLGASYYESNSLFSQNRIENMFVIPIPNTSS